MVSLTVQQRNLLRHLLNAPTAVAVAELAEQTDLSSRQVTYRLKSVKVWLAQRNVDLKSTPGVGIAINCSPSQRKVLLNELTTQSKFQLILSAGQRQQLLALHLLVAGEPLILHRLQNFTGVSRTTVLKDLDPIEAWSHTFGLNLIRRPNYGILFDGSELARRQALAALLWGDESFETPLTAMTYSTGLAFSLADNTSLPIVQKTTQLLDDLETLTAFEWVACAETQLGGRFTDDAVLHLALVFAIQAHRVRTGHRLTIKTEWLSWLETQKVWPVAVDISATIWPDLSLDSLTAEVAGIAMYLLAGLRSHVWPGDLEIDLALTDLVSVLMAEVARAFHTPALSHDASLRDGLVAHIIPAFMRQRFDLWIPPSWSDGAISRKWQQEYRIAQVLAQMITERTGIVLPNREIDTLALLLRAAFVRERPNHPKRVYIICPSGMATSQLLMARLKARFPGLDILGVLSLRELSSEQVADAQLLITTVPLQAPRSGLHVIQVHPLLTAENIEAITNWLASRAGPMVMS